MYYTIYKVTNQLDGKFYIGSHKTEKLDDDYMGSGKYLLHAQEKYGIENFRKEILFVFDTAEEMYAKEAELVNEDFLSTENTYNLKVGGFGGWDYINSKGLNKSFSEQGLMTLVNSGKNARDSKIGIFSRNKESHSNDSSLGAVNNIKKNGIPFLGKKHSTEAKQKIGENSSKHQTGSGNSQYGTRWVHSLELKISKRINKEEPLPEGWIEGRKIKF